MKTRTGTLLALCLLLLFPALAKAQVVGHTPEGDFIIRYEAPNGQPLYFTTLMEEPVADQVDLDLDGQDDLVILTRRGASNEFFEFFLSREGRYQQVENPGLEGPFGNYILHPNSGLIHVSVNHGQAGALRVEALLAFQGDRLVTRRRLLSENLTTWEMKGSQLITTQDNDRVKVRVWDVPPEGESQEGVITFEKVYDLSQMDSPLFEEMEAAFWQGLQK